jgi:hypothetical protein
LLNNSKYLDLKFAIEFAYKPCGLEVQYFSQNAESAEYGACSFELQAKVIEHRISKITPTKTGQFVSIWTRGKDGLTQPFDVSDTFDFVIISAKSGDNFGQFIFPKSVLVSKGIVSSNWRVGKRGIRVYPPWDAVNSTQAGYTQEWQSNYFVNIQNDGSSKFDLIRKLLEC